MFRLKCQDLYNEGMVCYKAVMCFLRRTNGHIKHENGFYSKRMVQPGLDSSGSVQGQVTSCCECGKDIQVP